MELAIKLLNQIKEFYMSLTGARKIAVISITALILAGIVSLVLSGTTNVYEPLMTNLSPGDSSNVIRFLREKNINYMVSDNGKTVMIPPESVMDVRLELSSVGMPETSVVGYEILDKQSFGTTSEVQKLNIKRANEGELTRTIQAIKPIKKARVHLSIPKKSPFLEKQDSPSASVVVELFPGMFLDEGQIRGITHLVASSVENLNPERITILDHRGKQLTKNVNGDEAKQQAVALEYQMRVEEEYRSKVVNLLERIVGEGMVDAQVTAKINFNKVSEHEVSYDPNATAVRSQQKLDDSLKGTRPTGLAAGAASQLPNQEGVAAPAPEAPKLTQDVVKSQNVTNYEVPKRTIVTEHPSAKIESISVAVLLNQKMESKVNAAGEAETVPVPWSADEILRFQNLVASALGLSLVPDEDGIIKDALKVENMAFFKEDMEKAEKEMATLSRQQNIGLGIRYSVIGLAILLFFWLVVRPFINWVTENTTDDITDYLPQTLEELEKAQDNQELPGMEELMPEMQKVDPVKAEGEYVRDRLIELVIADPQKAASIVHEMIHDKIKVKKKELKDAKEA